MRLYRECHIQLVFEIRFCGTGPADREDQVGASVGIWYMPGNELPSRWAVRLKCCGQRRLSQTRPRDETTFVSSREGNVEED